MKNDIPVWVWVLIIGLPLLSSLPILGGYLASSPPERVFMGFDFIDDFHYYGNYIHSYENNPLDFFILNRSTSENQDGRFFFPYFWITGLVSTGVGVALALAFMRILTGIILLFLVWKILEYFFPEPFWRKTAFVLACLGAGFGWITHVLGIFIPALGKLYSTDLTYSLGYSLFGYLSFPLAIAGEALFLAGLLSLFLFLEKKDKKYAFFFGLSLIGIFFTHPVSAVTFFPVFLGGALLYLVQNPSHKEILSFKNVGLAFAGALVLIGMYVWWALQDPVFQSVFFSYGLWQRSESPFWWILGYGLILLFALLGVRTLQIENKHARAFFWAWLLVILVLSLNPWKGLRFQHALFIPLVILATSGIRSAWDWIQKSPYSSWVKTRNAWVGLILVIMVPGVLFTLANHIKDVQNPSFHSGPFLSQEQIDALEFLEGQRPGIVLSNYKLGNNLIWMTSHYAYLGHWNQTTDREEKTLNVESFFNGKMTTTQAISFIATEKINYILREGTETIPPQLNGVERIYQNGTLFIYRVAAP
jgi:hypothetical protein